MSDQPAVSAPQPKSADEWAAMRSARLSAGPSVPVVTLAKFDNVTAAVEPAAPVVEPATPQPPVVEATAEPIAPPEPDQYAGVPPEIAERLRRQEAARVGEITKERNRRRAAEEQSAAAKTASDAQQARLDKMQATLDKLAAANEKPEEPRPVRTNFDNPDAYEQARDAWVEKQVVARESAKASAAVEAERARLAKETETRTFQEQSAALEASWNERAAKAIEVHLDFNEVAYSDAVPISETMKFAIWDDANGHEVAYHLGKNPDEAARIHALPPPRQIAALARLSATLEAQAKAKTSAEAAAKISRVAPTMKPVGGAQPATERTVYDMAKDGDMKAYAAKRLPELRAERMNGHLRQ